MFLNVKQNLSLFQCWDGQVQRKTTGGVSEEEIEEADLEDDQDDEDDAVDGTEVEEDCEVVNVDRTS